jgi:cation transport regulator
MPYKKNKELPEDIKDNLPEHAQEIWREAYNSAWDQYEDPEEREDPDEDRETVAIQVAWSAVKNEYEKVDGKWKKKSED